jgi:sugar O-acyltransferase (sialic acid O-acetyltransferase NeuD family)
MQKYIMIGTGGHANSIFDLVKNNGHEVKYVVGFTEGKQYFENIPVIKLEDLKNFSSEYKLLLGIGNFEIRNRVLEEIYLLKMDFKFPSVIHSSAYISKTTSVGSGTVIFANAYVGPNSSIGNFCVLNTNVSIEHDSLIGDQNFLAPSTTLAGNVATGEKCFFGMGSLISNNISIGSNSVIAANSFVDRNIPENSFAAGSPAELKK